MAKIMETVEFFKTIGDRKVSNVVPCVVSQSDNGILVLKVDSEIRPLELLSTGEEIAETLHKNTKATDSEISFETDTYGWTSNVIEGSMENVDGTITVFFD